MTSSASDTPRRPLNAVERAERNRRIAEERAAGASYEALAERYGLSARHVRRAEIAGMRRAALPAVTGGDGLDPAALVERVVGAHVLALDRLEALARRADNSSAQVGACRSLSTVGLGLVALLARLGLVGDPDTARFQSEMKVVIGALFDLADRHGIPPAEVAATVDRTPMRLAA